MPLCDEVSTTKFEVLLMILHLMLRHEITDVAVKDVLKLINSIFQEKKVIETEYSFRSIFKSKLKPDFHFYCSNCNTYLGEHSNPKEKRCEQNIKCPICNTDCDISKMNNGHFFITFSITVLDSIAKPLVQRIKQFNGFYGCNYYNNMLQAEQTGIEVRGVKGVSPVAVISEFNLVHGFVLDYMHCVLLGVIRLVTGLWLDSTSHKEKYYIGLKRHEIDNRLLAIRPPSSFPRLPRSLKERSFWKANEWRTWLLYYSLPCLKNILPLKYYKHHCLLVSAIYTFLRNKISISDIDNTTWNLVQYVTEFQKLYGPQNMTFNVHLLLHLGKTVLMFGPLWCYSAFSWESGNGFLLKFVKGTRGVLTQIARKYTYLQSLSRLLSQYNIADSTINYCSIIFNYHLQKHVTKFANVTLLGKEVEIPLTVEETVALSEEGIHITNICYERMIKDHVKYHSRCYAKQGSKTIDHIVKLDDNSYACIERFFVSSLNGQTSIFALLTAIILEDTEIVAPYSIGKVSHIKLCSFYMFGSLKIRPVQSIVQKAIMIRCSDTKCYIAQFPNIFEGD
ncbi:hypothetical protein ALC57_07547 [Trachymyrmex cornetzi]|uniref:Transposase domain-containing protein n=1 Tax=Trachymyrmex cornetzi TaxID=471704 RepID=A0A151J7Y2_9HYME|nr:hypothetical protein ALC57_07547 [Trachymyrmex cornetzi]